MKKYIVTVSAKANKIEVNPDGSWTDYCYDEFLYEPSEIEFKPNIIEADSEPEALRIIQAKMDKWYPNRAKRYTHLCAYHPEDYSQPIDSIPNETDIVNFKKLLISEGISEDDILDE